jgi:hypothetical protein
MKFKIADGREHFYQWDLNRQVVVLDPTIEEVHFSNKSEKEALVVNVVDGLANVPNILLQQCFNIRVYAVEDDVTLYETVFELIARPKPSNYVYEETEIKSYEYLENKLNEIEEKGFSEETVGNAVEGWLDENLDLDGYATKDYVDDAISSIDISDIDLSEYALKTDIPDVSDFISEIPSEYITESELASKGYLTEHQNLDHKADKIHSHDEYALKEHEHKQYLTEHQSLEGYAKESYVDNAIKNIEIPDVSDFITSIPEEYITESELENKGYLTEHQSLEDYALKTDIPDVSNFLTEVPSEYITETELNNKGYLTEHQDISHLATKEEIPSLEGYATEAYVDNKVSESGGGSSIPTYTIEWAKSSDTATQELMTRIYNGLFDNSFVLKRDYNLVLNYSGELINIDFIKSQSSNSGIKNLTTVSFYAFRAYPISPLAQPRYTGWDYTFYTSSGLWKENGTSVNTYMLYTQAQINSLTSRVSELEADVAAIKAQLGL